ncbi:MAG: Pyr redox 2 protein [Dehalococcoidia bacterium]|nr:Pyr redox 2 protein [Dehalococcoidia bacterium]
MAMKRHVIVGGGTAGLNAITTIREYDRGESEVVLLSGEWPYARMVLPYYLGHEISESHVFTATATRLAKLGVKPHIGRRATALDTKNNKLTLDDGTILEYDDLLIATGSSATRPPIPGANGPRIYNQWAMDDTRGVLAEIKGGMDVVMVGAGFISFTILNSVLSHGVNLHVIEVMPQVLPRMIDREAAILVQDWLRGRGVHIHTSTTVKAIEDVDGRKRLLLAEGGDLMADLVIMGTGIRPNLGWLAGSGIEINQGVLVDDHLRSNVSNVYAAGDVAEGPELITGKREVHAIEPTAMAHGRVVGANMVGRDIAYRGSLLMNILDVQQLDIASFGNWSAADRETSVLLEPRGHIYRKLVWDGDRIVGAVIMGPARGIWTTNDVGMLKGLIYSGVHLGAWKGYLQEHMKDLKKPFVACHVIRDMLPVTVLDHPTVPARDVVAVEPAG